jgi:hypothetical protein
MEKMPNPEQPEYRGLGTDLAAAALTGLTAGTANAIANQALDVVRKPSDSPPKDKKD